MILLLAMAAISDDHRYHDAGWCMAVVSLATGEAVALAILVVLLLVFNLVAQLYH